MAKRGINWKVLIISFLFVFGIAYIGSIFTSSQTNSDWYQSIKPSITPPNWVFPIVWNILFILIALSLYLAWTHADKRQKKKVAFVFGVNLLLNAFWSYLFFYKQNPQAGFYEIILILFSIIWMLMITRKINKTSFYLLIPYLLWVSFASVINYLAAFSY
jgi:tryptophan-rich sensory protein